MRVFTSIGNDAGGHSTSAADGSMGNEGGIWAGIPNKINITEIKR
jgi:hypothetical protein